MKISYKWMQDYIEFDWSVDELANRLTLAGAEVEGVDEVADDHCLHIEVTSNRPDWNGHLGLAREIAALHGATIHEPELAAYNGNSNDAVTVDLQADDLCSRYTAQLIKGVTIKESPAWLQARLETIGLRPINAVVDVTNYVMFEYNQPLHAFDADKLNGNTIGIRRAVKGEKMTAIDKRDYNLTESMLVIADADRPVAIAGVMGGADTEISDTTTNILLEVAHFDQLSVRQTSKALGLASDSSYRFERGVDLAQAAKVSMRAAQLIAEICGGELVGDLADAGTTTVPSRNVELTYDRLSKLLGFDIPTEDVLTILHSLGMEDVEDKGDLVSVTAPSFRADIREDVDLIEDVVRIHGLDKVPVSLNFAVSLPGQNKDHQAMDTLHSMLTGAGYFETVSDTFLLNVMDPFQHFATDSPALYARHPVRQEQKLLRKSLLPSLLLLKNNNENAGNKHVRLYEVAHTFQVDAGAVCEENVLGILSDLDFSTMKGQVVALLQRLGVAEPAFKYYEHPIFQEAASIHDGEEIIAYIGITSKQACAVADLKSVPCLCEIRLDPVLAKLAKNDNKFKGLNRFPCALRDLALVVDKSVVWQEVLDCINSVASNLLRNVTFFDVYEGKQIPDGKKSLAFNLEFQAPDRTLSSAEVDEYQTAIVSALQEKLSATLRK